MEAPGTENQVRQDLKVRDLMIFSNGKGNIETGN